MIESTQLEQATATALARSRGVVLSGPRQSGKSTLAQRFLHREGIEAVPLWAMLQQPQNPIA